MSSCSLQGQWMDLRDKPSHYYYYCQQTVAFALVLYSTPFNGPVLSSTASLTCKGMWTEEPTCNGGADASGTEEWCRSNIHGLQGKMMMEACSNSCVSISHQTDSLVTMCHTTALRENKKSKQKQRGAQHELQQLLCTEELRHLPLPANLEANGKSNHPLQVWFYWEKSLCTCPPQQGRCSKKTGSTTISITFLKVINCTTMEKTW